MTIGFIKIHRKLLDWEWYSDINTTRIFIHLLVTANYENKKWRGIDIARGQLITSLAQLAKSTTLSLQQTRTALTKLKSTNEITIRATKLHTFVTLTNYNLYQDRIIEGNTPSNTPFNITATKKQQRSNKEVTTTKEEKKIIREENKKEIDIQFEKFWTLYNHKKSKALAVKSFEKALKVDSLDNILAGLTKYVNSRGAESQFWKHPSTWLNQECWNDDYTSSQEKSKQIHNNFGDQDFNHKIEGFEYD